MKLKDLEKAELADLEDDADLCVAFALIFPTFVHISPLSPRLDHLTS